MITVSSNGREATREFSSREAFCEADTEMSFRFLNEEERKNLFKKTPSNPPAAAPCEGVTDTVFGGIQGFAASERPLYEGAAELLMERFDNRSAAVRNLDAKCMADTVATLGPNEADAPICVEEPGDVFDTQHDDLLLAVLRMAANSGELRCPARKGAEGQSRAKQASLHSPGVCNDKVLPPKGKVLSGPRRNTGRSAEMTDPLTTLVYGEHQRQSREERNKNGDRQCPSGRLYGLNTNYLHFVVDPTMLFEWTEPLKYTTQLASTRLCASRMFLRCTSRMFHFVADGWSA